MPVPPLELRPEPISSDHAGPPFALVAVGQTAAAGPTKCPAGEKRFKCHALAVHAHLGIDSLKPATCGGGVGDGVVRFDMRYHAVIELCPKTTWTQAVRKEMDKIDASCRRFESSGGRCER